MPPPPPMDINDWWLAAAAAAATGLLAPTASAATPTTGTVGIASAARPGVVSVSNERVVYIGNAVTFGERFKTDSTGVLHILFMDRSSMTLGPNSELVIDEFVFHPEAKQGSIAVNLITGTLRAVGGFVSKFITPLGRSAAQVRTPTATIGIRGGITLVEAQADSTRGVFLFGDYMQVSSPSGQLLQTVTRPGFSVTSTLDGAQEPVRVPAADMAQLVNLFESRQTTSPGSIGNLISTNDRSDGLKSPNTTLAPDRPKHVNSDVDTYNPAIALRDLLGGPATQVQS
ncbi:MAG: FecR domain-containing protein [Rhodoferax sp.]|jgi:hypothetical protein